MSGAACPRTCTVLVPQGQPSSLAPARPAAPQTKLQRPALRFRFSPALGSGSCPLARELLGESEKSRARRSSSRGGESGEAVPRGNLRPLARGDPWPSRVCPRWTRPGGRCRRCSCDLPLVCIRRGRPGTRGAFPAARPGLERRGPAHSGAEPWAEGALTLARQVGGGGAGSASGRWAGRVGAL